MEQLFPSGDDKQSPKFVDKLVKVFTKSGSEKWILVHVEVQGYNDTDFASRMFTYFCRIYDKHKKPVTSIAIFTDNNKNFRPSSFTYSFMGTENIFKYNVYKIIDQDEDELRKSNNPFAIVILTVLLALKKGKIPEEELLSRKIGLLRELSKKEIPKTKIQSLLAFLRLYVRFDNTENIAKFDNEINLITNKHNTMGIVEFVLVRAKNEGMAIGMEIKESEDNLRFVKSLLTETDFPSERIARIADVPVSFVEEVRASLTQASN